jgi:hypothetical protein
MLLTLMVARALSDGHPTANEGGQPKGTLEVQREHRVDELFVSLE